MDGVKGYQCDFVSQVSDEMQCKLCHNVARDLTMTMCCCQHYCRECIAPLKTGSKPCPGCGEETFDIHVHGRYQKLILALQVKCSMSVCGCDWIGELKDLSDHLDPKNEGCQYVDIECPNNCGTSVKRCDVTGHLERDCPKRDYSCEYCNREGTHTFIVADHIFACEQVEIACPNECMAGTIKRGELQEHLALCPYEQIYCKISGCEGKFIRDDQRSHEENNVLKHIGLLSKSVQKVDDCPERSDSHEQEMKKMLETMAKYERENAVLKQELRQNRTEIDDLREKLAKLSENFQRHLQAFNQHSKLLAGNSPYFFIISGFRERKITNTAWQSPPMYIQNGPKFSITLQPNGVSSTWAPRSYVSIALWAMNGEVDDRVNWPVACTIIVELRNQLSDRKHYRVKRGFRLECPTTGREKRGYFAPPPNAYEFISHDKLDFDTQNQTQFLKNDCLTLTVSVEVHSNIYIKRASFLSSYKCS